jgi:hypothetical protein
MRIKWSARPDADNLEWSFEHDVITYIGEGYIFHCCDLII